MRNRQTAAAFELKNRRKLTSKKDQFMLGMHVDRIVKGRNPFFTRGCCFDGSSVGRAPDKQLEDCYVFVYTSPRGAITTKYIPKERLEERIKSGEHLILSINDKDIDKLKKEILSIPGRSEKELSEGALGNIVKSIFYYAGECGVPLWEWKKLSCSPCINCKTEKPSIRIMTLEWRDTLPTIMASVYAGGVLVEKDRSPDELVLVKFEEFENGLVDLKQVSMRPGKRRVFDKRA